MFLDAVSLITRCIEDLKREGNTVVVKHDVAAPEAAAPRAAPLGRIENDERRDLQMFSVNSLIVPPDIDIVETLSRRLYL